MSESAARARAFMHEVQDKITNLLQEYARGEISQAQFDVIYGRYHGQLKLAEHAVNSGNDAAVDIAQSGPSTIAIREAAKGKAMGLAICPNYSDHVIDTLGEFNLPEEIVFPILDELWQTLKPGTQDNRYAERVADRQWLLFTMGQFTTVITLFHNEPSPVQIGEIERLHHDFEEANHNLLSRGTIDRTKLAYPFRVFIQQKLNR